MIILRLRPLRRCAVPVGYPSFWSPVAQGSGAMVSRAPVALRQAVYAMAQAKHPGSSMQRQDPPRNANECHRANERDRPNLVQRVIGSIELSALLRSQS
jgi:hypothetical protein